MQKYKVLLIFVLFCCILTAQTERVEIPINIHDGLGKGVSEHSMNNLNFIMNWDDFVWKDLIIKPKGLPSDWTNIYYGVEFLNQPQFIYQYVKLGQLPKEYMQNSWFNNAEFTETPIRCYLIFADGLDSEGKRRFVVDQNNNGDFSDDTFLYADSMVYEKGRTEIRVQFDRYINGEVVQQERTMYIGYDTQPLQMYFAKVAEYATCNIAGEDYILSPYGYNYAQYGEFEVIDFSDILPNGDVCFVEQPVKRNEYLKIGGDLYCFKAIDLNRELLILEKESHSQSEIISMQVGFRPYPFTGYEFSTRDSLSLDYYKGRTLLLMVWSPGCGMCYSKLPPMNKIYFSVDSSKVSILGLALHTDSAQLNLVKEEQAISFPLMLVKDDKIDDAYIRLIKPTFFLIDPEGLIIKKTLDLDEVDAMLFDLKLEK